MIRINLLPADLRRGNHLPAKVLGAAFGAALAVSGAIGWFGLVYFGDLGAAEAALQQEVTKLADRQKKVAYYEQLDANKKDYALRVQTIQDIGKSRRVWSRFLDELIDVVNNNGDTERHLAWVDGISVKSGDAKRGTVVSLPTSVQGKEQERIANFHDDLDASPFGKLVKKSAPQWKLEEDKGRIPPESLNFKLDLTFEPPVQAKAAPKAAPKPAAPAGK